jgi:hypothetical protein
MNSFAPVLRSLVRDAILGTAIGLAVLGVGGRIVMRVIALRTGAAPSFTLGGTLSIVAAGAAAGAVGALLYALARTAARRLAGGHAAVRLLVFFVLLALVTLRGLHGSPPASAALFWPLVLVYGLALDRASTHLDAPSRILAA